MKVTSGLRLQTCQIQPRGFNPMHNKSSAHLLLDFGASQRLGLDEKPCIRHLMQDLAPQPNCQGTDLCQVVEASKSDAAVGLLRRLEDHRRCRLRWGIAQEALRHVDKLLCCHPRSIFWICVLIRYPVVHAGETRRMRVADPSDANRGRLTRKNTQSVVAGVASQIHKDVNAIVPNDLGHLFISATLYVPPPWNEITKKAGLVILQRNITVTRDIDECGVVILQGCMYEV
mmetsp:Transcript_25955/g.45756  ORF Transcript_25955/g.45756 Transcript_25955/m.45756 type:complete len:230 (-) Transcript_25955:798-1487(-)